jgi:phenylalanyl-tRNA synthetase alpha chain
MYILENYPNFMNKALITTIEKNALEAIVLIKDQDTLARFETQFLGRKSELSTLLKDLKNLSPEDKKAFGPLLQTLRGKLQKLHDEKKTELENASRDWESERLDVTLPTKQDSVGHLHPITTLEHEVLSIFEHLGFSVAEGPEVETEWYNFDALNFPKNHPARDMQDTFWIVGGGAKVKKGNTTEKERLLMRTHTSPNQIRFMEKHKPPFRVIVPGRVFRNEATDASHEHTFHQFECLMLDETGKVNVATFKHLAETFFENFFGKKVTIRLRPSYFPFTEPSFEFDISCVLCDSAGCSTCKQSGWLEIGGAGMVHQNVLVAAGYPRGKYQGFAWGFGLTRLAMMKYKITDIRQFMGGDLRFIRQF